MSKASIRVETMVLPTYQEPPLEELPIFAEHRDHQRSTGRPYPNKVGLEVNRHTRKDKEYTVVHLENDYIDVLVLPEIGGRVFAAKDKTTDYDFFYRQHVIKPGLIGALGSWISGGIEFNWPYHHRPSGFMPCDYVLEECADGSVICWLSENDPIDRMKGMVGIVLRPEASYLETRVKLCNRNDTNRSFLWWENAAVPVHEQYQIFFPKDVTYVNFHYLDSRISYPIAGDGMFNGHNMFEPRDISWHKNSKDATSYFACASKYDFFGGYDHGKECGVVHIGDHHVSPGKKMFTWGYNMLSKTWENTLTDTDGQYAELMASSYSDNQPNFSWLEPYETKEFSQYWYPVSKIGTPDYANLSCAVSLKEDKVWLEATEMIGSAKLEISCGDQMVLSQDVVLETCKPISLDWQKPQGLLKVVITAANGKNIVRYQEETPDNLKKPPIREPMAHAQDMTSADDLFRAGVHVDQYRDPSIMPDAFWLEALKRDPYHADSLLGMARYCYQKARFEEAKDYAERAIEVLTKYNERTLSGDVWYQYALILEELGQLDKAYDYYYKASWNGSAVAKAMARAACIDLKKGEYALAEDHARRAIKHDLLHPLATVALVLALRGQGKCAEADKVAAFALEEDKLNQLMNWLVSKDKAAFFAALEAEPAQTVLDMAYDLELMGQKDLAVQLLKELIEFRPEEKKVMICYTLAYLTGYADLVKDGDVAPLGRSYPMRHAEIRVLQYAIEQGSSHAPFLLGCLFYDKRQYELAGRLFEKACKLEPENYMTHRSLAVAYFSHLHRKDEALPLMKKALRLKFTQQLLFETVALMDALCMDPEEKIDLMERYWSMVDRDDLFVEMAKACNQAGKPEKAIEVLRQHKFVACEGGEHAIADQYMFAHFQIGVAREKACDYAGALEAYYGAINLPQDLGAGIWNRCKTVPYEYRIALCLEKLGRQAEANEIFRTIVDIYHESFGLGALPELPFYQAMSAEALGMSQRAWNLMGQAKRQWTKELTKRDDGFFAKVPHFISFIQEPAILRKAHFSYLLAFVSLYEGKKDEAKKLFRESFASNMDNMFCNYYAK